MPQIRSNRDKRLTSSLTAMLVAAAMIAVVTGCMNRHTPTTPPGVKSYVQGMRAYESGDHNAAMTALIKATRENPDLTMPHVMLGTMYKSDGSYRQAADQFEQAIRLDPYGYQNYYNLGVSYQFMSRLQEAAASYLHALRLSPNDVNTNMNLGLVYLSLNHIDDALLYLRRATECGPTYGPAWANLGVILDVKHEYAEAERAYRRSLEYDSTNASTLLNLGDNLLVQDKAQDAISVFNETIKRSNTAVARKRLGDALMRAGRTYEGLQEYNASLKLDKTYYPAMNEIGRLLIAKYQNEIELDESLRETAVKYWKRSLEISPQQPKVVAWMKEWQKEKM